MKKVPVITVDEAISKLRLFQGLIVSQHWEDKVCVVALEMGIRALQKQQMEGMVTKVLNEEEANAVIAFVKNHEREEIPDDVWDVCEKLMNEFGIW